MSPSEVLAFVVQSFSGDDLPAKEDLHIFKPGLLNQHSSGCFGGGDKLPCLQVPPSTPKVR